MYIYTVPSQVFFTTVSTTHYSFYDSYFLFLRYPLEGLMKYSFALTGLALCFTSTMAFPSRMFDTAQSMSEEERRSLESITGQIEAGIEKRVSTPRSTGFSASDQYVSNTGKHAFVAPGNGDLRGPCPGLNAMANHGYIPHNGVATVTQFIQGTYDGKSLCYLIDSYLILIQITVFGMGVDLGASLYMALSLTEI